MQFIKYILLFLIFIASNLIGKTISQQYKFRLQELEEIKNALNIFKTKIRFTYTPIGEVFEEISLQTKKQNIKKLFQNAKQALEDRLCKRSMGICLKKYNN